MNETAVRAVIRLENITKTYDTGAIQVRALMDVNLLIAEGEFVAVMGQSGSGKSTLLNILGCLDRPTGGKFYLGDEDVSGMGPKELATVRNKKIGFVFQSFNLIPRTTALKNVELPMIYARKSKSERRRRAAELLERVGLGDRAEHLPNELSGGQKQRVAIARALVNRPQMLLADEPTGNLDTASSLEIMELFSVLNQEGVTVVVVTHEEEIAAYCRRVVRFKDGRLVSDVSREPVRPGASGFKQQAAFDTGLDRSNPAQPGAAGFGPVPAGQPVSGAGSEAGAIREGGAFPPALEAKAGTGAGPRDGVSAEAGPALEGGAPC